MVHHITGEYNLDCRIQDLQNDPSWTPSFGEKLGMIHYRQNHWHAECDPNTGICQIHYDRHDPQESLTSLIQHMVESKLGSVVLFGSVIIALDYFFNNN